MCYSKCLNQLFYHIAPIWGSCVFVIQLFYYVYNFALNCGLFPWLWGVLTRLVDSLVTILHTSLASGMRLRARLLMAIIIFNKIMI